RIAVVIPGDVGQVVLDNLADDSLARVSSDQLTTRFGAGEVPQHIDAIGGQFLRGEHILTAKELLEPVQRRSDLLRSDPGLTECIKDMRLGERDERHWKPVAIARSDVDERLATLVS